MKANVFFVDMDKKAQNATERAIVAESLTLAQVCKTIPTGVVKVENLGNVCAGEYLSEKFGLVYATRSNFKSRDVRKAWHEEMSIDGDLATFEIKTLCAKVWNPETRTDNYIPMYQAVSKNGVVSYEKVTASVLTKVGEHSWSVRRIIKGLNQKLTFDTCKLEAKTSQDTVQKLVLAQTQSVMDNHVGTLYMERSYKLVMGEDGKRHKQADMVTWNHTDFVLA